jgi:hypothetical protein
MKYNSFEFEWYSHKFFEYDPVLEQVELLRWVLEQLHRVDVEQLNELSARIGIGED